MLATIKPAPIMTSSLCLWQAGNLLYRHLSQNFPAFCKPTTVAFRFSTGTAVTFEKLKIFQQTNKRTQPFFISKQQQHQLVSFLISLRFVHESLQMRRRRPRVCFLSICVVADIRRFISVCLVYYCRFSFLW